MISFQKNGRLIVVHVVKNFMLLLKNIWKETSGSIHIQMIALVDGND